MSRKQKALIALIVAIAFGAALFSGTALDRHASAQSAARTEGAETGTAAALPLIGNPYAIADVVESVIPSVVYVEVEWPAPERPRRTPFDDPFFRDFFFFPFTPWPETGPRTSRGTGFIIDEEGHILTNQHVVGNPGEGQKVTVKINAPGFEGDVEAEVIGADYLLDIAVLKIDRPDALDRLPTAVLGDSNKSRPGEWVIAIGNPYGEQFEHTVTVGVLSAKGRKIQIYDEELRRWREYTDLMQTDAAINPGNSGGPLVNLNGEVIGINTAVSASAQGIGFAVPISSALEIKDELITNGEVVRPVERYAFLGVQYEELTNQVARSLGLDSTDGVLVTVVLPDTAASKAGIRVWDVILQVGDQEITDGESLSAAIRSHEPGDDALLLVYRQGRRIPVPVTLGDSADHQ